MLLPGYGCRSVYDTPVAYDTPVCLRHTRCLRYAGLLTTHPLLTIRRPTYDMPVLLRHTGCLRYADLLTERPVYVIYLFTTGIILNNAVTAKLAANISTASKGTDSRALKESVSRPLSPR